MKDPFFVFSKIKNTPQYWKTRRLELVAKLENKGPFQYFFTLSCADCRWDENFTSSMHDVGILLSYDGDENTEEITTKLVIGEETLTIDEYLTDKRFCDDSRHAQIRKNVLEATRNFDNRVKSFVKNIIMAKDNPMNTKPYNFRVEFQARGAAHIHGVLWIDFDRKLPHNINNIQIKSAFRKFRMSDALTSE